MRELKRQLDERGIYYKDCVEKKDLVKRLKVKRRHCRAAFAFFGPPPPMPGTPYLPYLLQDSMGVATSCFGGSGDATGVTVSLHPVYASYESLCEGVARLQMVMDGGPVGASAELLVRIRARGIVP